MNISNLHRPLILFFNSFFDSPPDVSGIKEEYRKKFTWDREMLEHADAVVFHVPDLVFGKPDIDCFMKLKKWPKQLWVAWSMESAVNYPVLKDPRFLSRIDILMTYKRSSNIWTSYHPAKKKWLEALRQPLPKKNEIAPLVMFQSAAFNRSGRIEFASNLMKKTKTDSYGKLLNNRSLSINDEGRSTKLSTISRYKFCLSLENSIDRDYVTEKFFDPLLVGTVPVYRGLPTLRSLPREKNVSLMRTSFPAWKNWRIMYDFWILTMMPTVNSLRGGKRRLPGALRKTCIWWKKIILKNSCGSCLKK